MACDLRCEALIVLLPEGLKGVRVRGRARVRVRVRVSVS